MILIILPILSYSQVKIGNNPSIIDSNSILELESNEKVFVLTRITDAQMNTIVPLEGALIYNIDSECIFAYDGTRWKNLCDEPLISVTATAPTANEIGDYWFNPTNNIASIWDGSEWLPININPRSGNGLPDNNVLDNVVAGDIYVDEDTGDLFTYNGADWIMINQILNADNGVSITSNTIQLGGALISPTVITTDSTNTLALLGLPQTTLDGSNSVVVADNVTGELAQVSATNLVQQQQVVIIATEGQSQFTPPLNALDINKIEVYRNGARISFTIINPTTLEVEPEASCFAGDEIRIVQLN
ncbi:hypothetical protein ACFQ1Q_07985 [Winogradskyella litorisediminis]|uniref:Uncharacterized protein n=1 Tax=Winogradskyella litorisediminis TaxID=1156618 RepID=A0ABW3N698_9FLAO